MNWEFNKENKIWVPVPDILERNESIDYIIQQRPKTFQKMTIKNDPIAVDDLEKRIVGNYLYVETPTKLSIKLNDQGNDSIEVSNGDIIRARFYKIFITADSRTEAPIILYAGKNTEIEKPKNRDLERIFSLTGYAASPYNKIINYGKQLRNLIIVFWHTYTVPPVYIDLVSIGLQKYVGGSLATLWTYLTAPTSSNYGEWGGVGGINVSEYPGSGSVTGILQIPTGASGQELNFAVDKIFVTVEFNTLISLTNSRIDVYTQES